MVQKRRFIIKINGIFRITFLQQLVLSFLILILMIDVLFMKLGVTK